MGGQGQKKTLDLAMEHLNGALKKLLRNLEANLNEDTRVRCSRVSRLMNRFVCKLDENLEFKEGSGNHSVSQAERDLNECVGALTEAAVFYKFLDASTRHFLPSEVLCCHI